MNQAIAVDEAEYLLIGSVLQNGSLLHEVRASLLPQDFRHSHMRRLYSRMCEMADAGRDIEQYAVLQFLIDRKGEDSELVAIATDCADKAFRRPHVREYIAEVREASQRRAIALLGEQLTQRAFSREESSAEIIADADRRLLDIAAESVSQEANLAQQSTDAMARIDGKRRGEIAACYRTGIGLLDVFAGGLGIGELTIVAGRPSMGKCLKVGTKVLMYSGDLDTVENIQPGDLLMGIDSKPRTVLGTTRGVGELFEVTPVKGKPYTVNSEHVLSLRNTDSGAVTNITISDFLEKSERFRTRNKGWRTGVEFHSRAVDIPPYVLGVWLGDGTATQPCITNPDPEIALALREYVETAGLRLYEADYSGCPSLCVRGNGGENTFWSAIKNYGLDGCKRIPRDYLVNDRDSRLQLLAGLIDSDGHLVSGCCEISQKSAELVADMEFLVRSLGLAINTSSSVKRATNSPGHAGSIYHRMFISGDLDQIPTRVARKQFAKRRKARTVLNTGITVRPTGLGEYAGFEISDDGLFLLDDFTVTHNSCCVAQAVVTNCPAGHACHVISIEMSADELLARIWAAVSGVPAGRISDPTYMTDEEAAKVREAMLEVSQWPLQIDDNAVISTDQIIARAKVIKRRIDTAVLAVDYLQRITFPGSKQERYMHVGEAAKRLAEFAKAEKVAAMLLSSLTERTGNAANIPPSLTDLRESGDVQYHAHKAYLIHREREESGIVPHTKFLVAKNRHGRTGVVDAMFNTKSLMFEDVQGGQHVN